jgi:hypothetical protein
MDGVEAGCESRLIIVAIRALLLVRRKTKNSSGFVKFIHIYHQLLQRKYD